MDKFEPYPALVISLSSSTRRDASTASVAVAPAFRNRIPISAALPWSVNVEVLSRIGYSRNTSLKVHVLVLVTMESGAGVNEDGRDLLWFVAQA